MLKLMDKDSQFYAQNFCLSQPMLLLSGDMIKDKTQDKNSLIKSILIDAMRSLFTQNEQETFFVDQYVYSNA